MATVPSAQPATIPKATQGLPSVSSELCLEILRYFLYVLDLIFGVLMWGVTADQIICGYALIICDVIIAFGVINMLLLLAIITWHSLRFCKMPFLPYLIEGITFTVMAVIWLGLAAGAVVEFKLAIGSVFRTATAGGWLAAVTHAGSAVLAFIQARIGAVKEKSGTEPVSPTVLALGGSAVQPQVQPMQPGQPMQQGRFVQAQGAHYGQLQAQQFSQQSVPYAVPQTPQYVQVQPGYASPTSQV